MWLIKGESFALKHYPSNARHSDSISQISVSQWSCWKEFLLVIKSLCMSVPSQEPLSSHILFSTLHFSYKIVPPFFFSWHYSTPFDFINIKKCNTFIKKKFVTLIHLYSIISEFRNTTDFFKFIYEFSQRPNIVFPI